MPVDYALKLAEGLTAKLNFDYACNRGHSFGEYHAHGVVNEILSANVDPAVHRVRASYAHTALQVEGSVGRKREVDFLLQRREPESNELFVELKWAGSGYCTPERILLDLCRLHLIKAAELGSTCLFIISGPAQDISNLFQKSFLTPGTRSLLHRPGPNGMTKRTTRRVKSFGLNGHGEHQVDVDRFKAGLGAALPVVPEQIRTSLKLATRSETELARFETLVWNVEGAATQARAGEAA